AAEPALCPGGALRGQVWTPPVVALGAAVALWVPAGRFLARVLDGRCRPPRWLRWPEARLDTGPQSWKQYAVALLLFNTLMFVVAYAALALQPWLPLNPDRRGALAPTTVFHTAVSFFTNNSQQHYAGEQPLSYFTHPL